MSLLTISVYQFRTLDGLPFLRQEIKQKCLRLQLKGTILLASEGFNCFLSGQPEQISLFKEYLEVDLGFRNLFYKENICFKHPFTRMLVKIKKEIIPMGRDNIRPSELTAPYLSADRLKSWLDDKKEVILLDTRNDYEVDVGTFEKAIHFNLKSFREFATASRQLPEKLKNKTIVMFCTGGIRCEKASAYFIQEGYKDIYQLEGGILKYFEQCKNAHFIGNCFVFDWRLAVDCELQPVNSQEEVSKNSGRHQQKIMSK